MPAGTASPVRRLVTVVMDVLVIVAVLLVAHMVVSFFGQLSGAAWGKGLLNLTRLAVVPLGVSPIATPYGGTFDVNAACTILLLLGGEWVLGLARRNA
jgi:hypothetical protein